MITYQKYFKNKKVLITGHTGFKGSWLTLWLKLMGANIFGVSNSYPKKNNHFSALKLKGIKNYNLDICELQKLKKLIFKIKPDFIFHLAAQSLVKKSYKFPLKTFHSNSVGTLNLLESLRSLKNNCNVVLITSDKSYRNIETNRGYKEEDVLGGEDPYSASKACAELIITSYIKNFINKKNINIAVARAGNVIGGGDWSDDRIIPDSMKSWSVGDKAVIRNPSSTRPWQFVLEVLRGYLILSIKLKKDNQRKLFGQAFNFGPNSKQNKTVISLVREIKKNFQNIKWKISKSTNKIKESRLLRLNSSKSSKILNWQPILNFEKTIHFTSEWYMNDLKKKKNTYENSKSILTNYCSLISKKI